MQASTLALYLNSIICKKQKENSKVKFENY